MKRRKSPEQYKQELYNINPYIELLTPYKNTRTKVSCNCLICGYKWSPYPSDILRGSGCPNCVASKGELIICGYLNDKNIKYYYDFPYFEDLYGNSNRLLRPDFIIPDKKIWIEYDGRQHYEPVNFKENKDIKGANENYKIIKLNDEIKNNYAKENGWELLRISYTDYDNIEIILDEYFEEGDSEI